MTDLLNQTPQKLTMSDKRSSLSILAISALAAALSAGLCQSAAADDGPRGAHVPLLPRYQIECAACHLAYPPELLSAASWQRLMTRLPSHFGTDGYFAASFLKR